MNNIKFWNKLYDYCSCSNYNYWLYIYDDNYKIAENIAKCGISAILYYLLARIHRNKDETFSLPTTKY